MRLGAGARDGFLHALANAVCQHLGAHVSALCGLRSLTRWAPRLCHQSRTQPGTGPLSRNQGERGVPRATGEHHPSPGPSGDHGVHARQLGIGTGIVVKRAPIPPHAVLRTCRVGRDLCALDTCPARIQRSDGHDLGARRSRPCECKARQAHGTEGNQWRLVNARGRLHADRSDRVVV